MAEPLGDREARVVELDVGTVTVNPEAVRRTVADGKVERLPDAAPAQSPVPAALGRSGAPPGTTE